MSDIEPTRQDPATGRGTLRQRTDEIELIISSLTMVALFALPGWLFERFAESFTHLSVVAAIASGSGVVVATGLCYGLGIGFLVHLLTRAYWVGLIGVRTAFPGGIDWRRTPGIGPLTRERHQRRLPDIDTAIERADRLASSLFAVISVVALTLAWIGLLLIVTTVVAGTIGERFGMINAAIGRAALAVLILLIAVPLLLALLDAGLLARWPSLQRSRVLTGAVATLAWLQARLYPQRLVLPVQLTLQSNTRPLLLLTMLLAALVTMLWIGQGSANRAIRFTLSQEFSHLTGSDLSNPGVFVSSYYEDLRSERDRLRPWPLLRSFEQRGAFVQVFLPYYPLRDNPLLDDLCRSNSIDRGAACLKQIWSVQLAEGDPEDTVFVAAERMDLNMRGVLAVLPLDGLAPGLHELHVTWNPTPAADGVASDDRYVSTRQDYRIPFLFTPDYELNLPEQEPEPDTKPLAEPTPAVPL